MTIILFFTDGFVQWWEKMIVLETPVAEEGFI